MVASFAVVQSSCTTVTVGRCVGLACSKFVFQCTEFQTRGLSLRYSRIYLTVVGVCSANVCCRRLEAFVAAACWRDFLRTADPHTLPACAVAYALGGRKVARNLGHLLIGRGTQRPWVEIPLYGRFVRFCSHVIS